MARERYLIGVDTEKLQAERVPERPLTFREKLGKFWYNYQWWVIIGAVVLILIIFAAILVGKKEKADYTLVLVTKGKLAQTAMDELADELERVGEDLDGNGKVTVQVIPLVMTDDGDYVELATIFGSGSNVGMRLTELKGILDSDLNGDSNGVLDMRSGGHTIFTKNEVTEEQT